MNEIPGFWSATDYFRGLIELNKMAVREKVKFCQVSSLQGFQDVLAELKGRRPVFAASDTSYGNLYTENTPHFERIKLFFIAFPCPLDKMEARENAMRKVRDLFRQLISALLLEKTRLEQDHIYIDEEITFNEIDKYVFSGMAAAYFNVRVINYTDTSYNPDEWLTTN